MLDWVSQPTPLLSEEYFFEESGMSSFTLKIAQVIKRQKEDVRGALLNSGPYKLVEEFSHSQLIPQQWFSMSTTQRQAHEKKIRRCIFPGRGRTSTNTAANT